MAEPVYVGHELKVLNHKIRRLAEGNMAQHPCGGMTEVQGRVLGYLTHHPGRDICQRDVEETFGITRATASKMLGDMERNGLILRCGADYDARRKNLKLTEKAQHLSQEIQAGITEFEAVLTAGFTEEERRELLRAINRFLDALPETRRDIFVCRYWYLDSIEDIGARFGYSQSKVTTILFRLRKKLAAHLEKEGLQ